MRKVKDLAGQKFGRLTVIERSEDIVSKNGNLTLTWRCICDCGKEIIVRSNHLKAGTISSCGCLRLDKIMTNDNVERLKDMAIQNGAKNFIDITGMKFGKLTVIRQVDGKKRPSGESRGASWECQCDCGNITEAIGYKLRNGETKSCGCLRGKRKTL